MTTLLGATFTSLVITRAITAAQRERFRVHCLIQGHFGMWTAGGEDRATDLLITR